MDTSTLPTKNNLMRLKEKIRLSKQGHDLLEKKKFILTVEKDKIKNDELIKELEYRYTNDDFSFNITKGKIFLIKSENKNKLYKKLKAINLEEEIIIIPDYYKAYNLMY